MQHTDLWHCVWWKRAGPVASRRLSADTSSCSSPETLRQLHSLWERTICGSLSALHEQGVLALAMLTVAIIAPLYLTQRHALEPTNQTLRMTRRDRVFYRPAGRVRNTATSLGYVVIASANPACIIHRFHIACFQESTV
ncbi:uncharacterized [Tachysurus ichikawai]